ncbi:MAG: sel1 repeat family protein [Gammaproteobacteria bacterium]|nr:sel1 repeat family protein [Gammaproteobacteria bacterium]
MMKKLLLLAHILLAGSLAATSARASEQPADDHVPALEQGQAAFNTGNYGQAFSLWQTLATQGHSEAQVFVGLAYANGWGVDRDPRLAGVWYRKAAENGNPSGQFFLGLYYLSGDESRFAAGLAWLKRAAKNG